MKSMVRARQHFTVANPAAFQEALYQRALTFLLRMPSVTAQSFVDVLGISHTAAKEILARMVREGKLGEPDSRGRRPVLS